VFVDQDQHPDFSLETEATGDEDDSGADEVVIPRNQYQSEIECTATSGAFASPHSASSGVDHASSARGRAYTPRDATLAWPRLPPIVLSVESGRSSSLVQQGNDDPVGLDCALQQVHNSFPNLPSDSSLVSSPKSGLLPLRSDESLLLRYFMTDLVSWVSSSISQGSLTLFLRSSATNHIKG
jgi:hypothetical protein